MDKVNVINILHINTTKEWRGGDMQMLTTYNLVKGYSGVRQVIFCPEGSKMSIALKSQGVDHETAHENKKFTFKYFFKILQLVKSKDIDILHAHDSYSLTLATAVAFFHPGVKIVYSRKRNNPIKNNFIKRFKFNTKKIHKIVCVSEGVKKIFNPILKDQDKAVVIYDGVDVDLISAQKSFNTLRNEFHLSNDSLIIGNIAALLPQKDLFTFIDAAALILQSSKRDIAFIVVGEGYLKDELVNYASAKGVKDKIIFTGFRSEAYKLLMEFDMLMMSSETEGLPLVVFEAFAAGVPVVATDAGGTSEAVVHGETGLLSPVGDASALANNVLQFISGKFSRAAILNNAFEKVKAKHTLEVMGRNYYELYTGLMR